MSRFVKPSTPEQFAKLSKWQQAINKNGYTQVSFALTLIAVFGIVVLFLI